MVADKPVRQMKRGRGATVQRNLLLQVLAAGGLLTYLRVNTPRSPERATYEIQVNGADLVLTTSDVETYVRGLLAGLTARGDGQQDLEAALREHAPSEIFAAGQLAGLRSAADPLTDDQTRQVREHLLLLTPTASLLAEPGDPDQAAP